MEEIGFGALTLEAVESSVWLVGMTEHWTVVVFGLWVVVVTEFEVGAVVAVVSEVWTVTLFGP